MMMEPVLVITLAAVLVVAIGTDLHSSRIPNWLTFPAMGFALLGHAWLGGLPEVFFGLAGCGVGLGLFLIPYISGGVGAGDVKLMAAIGALVGPSGALMSGLLAIIVGGAYAVGAMCFQWGLRATYQRSVNAAMGVFLTGGKGWGQELALPFRLRYGLAIAGGTLLFQLGLHPFEG